LELALDFSQILKLLKKDVFRIVYLINIFNIYDTKNMPINIYF
jgi:hypothetical protein